MNMLQQPDTGTLIIVWVTVLQLNNNRLYGHHRIPAVPLTNEELLLSVSVLFPLHRGRLLSITLLLSYHTYVTTGTIPVHILCIG
jgi:hypothetical protein